MWRRVRPMYTNTNGRVVIRQSTEGLMRGRWPHEPLRCMQRVGPSMARTFQCMRNCSMHSPGGAFMDETSRSGTSTVGQPRSTSRQSTSRTRDEARESATGMVGTRGRSEDFGRTGETGGRHQGETDGWSRGVIDRVKEGATARLEAQKDRATEGLKHGRRGREEDHRHAAERKARHRGAVRRADRRPASAFIDRAARKGRHAAGRRSGTPRAASARDLRRPQLRGGPVDGQTCLQERAIRERSAARNSAPAGGYSG